MDVCNLLNPLLVRNRILSKRRIGNTYCCNVWVVLIEITVIIDYRIIVLEYVVHHSYQTKTSNYVITD